MIPPEDFRGLARRDRLRWATIAVLVAIAIIVGLWLTDHKSVIHAQVL